MKTTILPFYFILLFLLASLSACSKEGQQTQERTYHVTGVLTADSTMVLDNLMLISDNHSSMRIDTITLDATGRFESQFRTAGFDELFLCSDAGELCRFYATTGMEVELSLAHGEEGLTTTFTRTETDSINPWLQAMDSLFVTPHERRRHAIMDSIVASADSSLRVTLLLRDHLMDFQDSLYVRRLLGGMSASLKPDWLVKSIDHLLNEKSASKNRTRRVTAASFEMKNDSVLFNMGDSRSDYLLVYLWADYSQESVDSLSMLAKLVKDKYSDKRLQLITCCLHTPDSVHWDSTLTKLEGRHTWVKAGFGDSRIHDWGIRSVPSLLLLDMYNNQQQRDTWGEPLRRALDRLPKKNLSNSK